MMAETTVTQTATDGVLLTAKNLTVDLRLGRQTRRVIHDVSLSISPGEAVGIVGESGSGKSMTARTIMRLLPRGAQVGGELRFEDRAIGRLDRRAMRRFRQTSVGMIYQDPRAHINPLRTIGQFLTEGVCDAKVMSAKQARHRAIETLADVGIPDGERRMRQYPHQLSGGLLQRVMIASVLLAEPRLILADEPTTALDVTTQQEVVAILDEQRRERGMALIFITHDLELATAVTDRIAVMYAGMIVETAPARDLHNTAIHPYTRALLQSRPRVDRVEPLQAIPGRPISAFETGPGCVFASRCAWADDHAREIRPEVRAVGAHRVACHRAEEFSAQASVGSARA